MKFKSLAISLGVLALLATLAGPVAQAQNSPRYTVVDLGPLGGTYSQSFYVSSKGVASGQASLANGDWHAVLWQNGKERDLGTFGGPDSTVYFGGPNATGQVAGFAETSTPDPNGEDFCGFAAQLVPSSGTCLGFLWQHGSMTPLSTLGGFNSAANAINDSGVIAGTAETATPDIECPGPQVLHFEPVVWDKGKVKELPTYGGDPDGIAVAINNHGQVAGASGDCSAFNVTSFYYLSPVHALLWQNGTVTNLGSLGGAFGNQAHGINNRGQVVGASDLAGDTVFHGFVWSQSTGMQDIAPLPGDTYSYALAINDAGVVTGLSIDSSFTVLRAFMVVNGVPTDLNTLIPANSPLQLQTACSINSSGEIVGLAAEKSTGDFHGYLAIPVASASRGH
jgi:probable HAF family extracellular repeat protein